MTSFDIIYFFKGPISKYSHTLRYRGLGPQHMNFGGDTIQPITERKQEEKGDGNKKIT